MTELRELPSAQVKDFANGMFAGDFEPAAFRTTTMDLAIQNYEAGYSEAPHRHVQTEKHWVVLDGRIQVNGKEYEANTIVTVPQGHAAEFEALTDCRILLIQFPSIRGDRIELAEA